MYRSIWVSSWSLVLLALPISASAQDKPRLADVLALEETMQEAIRKAEPSIACILVSRSDEAHRIDLSSPDHIPESYGSGVVIDEKGLILTNRHVVTGAARIFVRLPGGKATYAEIHADDPRSDLAVLRPVDGKALLVPVIKIGDGGSVRKGQFVLSLANPFAAGFRDGSPSASWGILSNIRRRVPGATREEARDKPLHHYGTLLQTDARLNLGCSGGALIDLKGELIGLTSAMAAIAGGETPGGFAVPMDAGMRRIIEKLRLGEEVEYGFLGVVFDLSHRGPGVRLEQVLQGSPAFAGRLRDGDVVLKVNGVEVHDRDDLFLMIGTSLAGSTVRLDVRSPGGPARQETVTLGKYYVPEDKLGKPVVSKKPPALGGLRVDWTTVLAQRTFHRGGILPGVTIREVQANSSAEREKLQVDKVITQVAGKSVNTPREFYDAMEDARRSGKGAVELTLYISGGRQDKVTIDIR